MITIYGSPMSSSGRCFWCLEEVGQKYEAKSIDFKKGEHKSEEFLKINPNGKIPALVDGDFKIWESMGINFYLAEAYKPSLLGKTAQEKGIVHQWSIWSIADLQAPMIDIFIQMVFVPEEHRDQKIIEKALEKLPKLFKSLDDGLQDRDYLLGNEFSLADLNVASVVVLCHPIKFDLSPYANVMKWYKKIGERESFQSYQKLL